MQEPKYIKEIYTAVNLVDIGIYDLGYCTNNVLWHEVKELLKDNDLWDSYSEHYRHHYYIDSDDHEDEFEIYFRDANRIYAVRYKYENNNDLSTSENKNIFYSPDEKLYKYIYRPDYNHAVYSQHKGYSVVLPIDELYEGYIIILLKNDNVIVGTYGRTEFGCQIDNCHYYNNNKQTPFNKLDEPFKNLIIEKLVEEKEKGLDMNNLLHLLPK